MSSDYNCRFMKMSSLTYIARFSAKFLFQAIYHSFSEKQPKCKLCVSKYEMVQNHSMFVQSETSVPGV